VQLLDTGQWHSADFVDKVLASYHLRERKQQRARNKRQVLVNARFRNEPQVLQYEKGKKGPRTFSRGRNSTFT
jgi:hypothetical protein